jgi:hypothetical protein
MAQGICGELVKLGQEKTHICEEKAEGAQTRGNNQSKPAANNEQNLSACMDRRQQLIDGGSRSHLQNCVD